MKSRNQALTFLFRIFYYCYFLSIKRKKCIDFCKKAKDIGVISEELRKRIKIGRRGISYFECLSFSKEVKSVTIYDK